MIVWLNPVGGVSGDMLLAALLDAGASPDAVRSAVASSGLAGWDIKIEHVQSGAVRATRVRVEVDDTATQRDAAELRQLVARARPEPVAALALDALDALVAAEARVHDVPAERVHLHELGGHDTVVDLVGVAAALHDLGVNRVVSAPLPLSVGTTDSLHGRLPVPAPATLALVAGMAVTGSDAGFETVTPTGAALLRAAGVRFTPMPSMTVESSGYGTGMRELPGGNLLVAVLGRAAESPAVQGDPQTETLVVVETTVDDVTGELLGYVSAVLLEAGAADVWITPVIGKKGRPAQVISVLAAPALADALEARLLAETGSLGARRSLVARHALSRTTSTVTVDGFPVRIKHGPHRAKPEFDDLAALAAATGRTLSEATNAVAAASPAVHREPAGTDRDAVFPTVFPEGRR